MSSSPRRSAELGITWLRVGLGTMWIANAPFAAELFGGLALWLAGDGAFSLRRSTRLVPGF